MRADSVRVHRGPCGRRAQGHRGLRVALYAAPRIRLYAQTAGQAKGELIAAITIKPHITASSHSGQMTLPALPEHYKTYVF